MEELFKEFPEIAKQDVPAVDAVQMAETGRIMAEEYLIEPMQMMEMPEAHETAITEKH